MCAHKHVYDSETDTIAASFHPIVSINPIDPFYSLFAVCINHNFAVGLCKETPGLDHRPSFPLISEWYMALQVLKCALQCHLMASKILTLEP